MTPTGFRRLLLATAVLLAVAGPALAQFGGAPTGQPEPGAAAPAPPAPPPVWNLPPASLPAGPPSGQAAAPGPTSPPAPGFSAAPPAAPGGAATQPSAGTGQPMPPSAAAPVTPDSTATQPFASPVPPQAAPPAPPPAAAAPPTTPYYAPPPAPPPSAAAPVPPPLPGVPPGQAYPPPAPPGPVAGNAPSAQPVIEFAPLSQAFSLVRDSAAYLAASQQAPQIYPLRAGTAVMAVARSSNGQWVVALTADGQAAYLPSHDLGPYDPAHAPTPELPATVKGSAQVVDTATLVIDGQHLTLAGVDGESGDYAKQLQGLIDSQGHIVECVLAGTGYVCKLPNGMDIARSALYNGAARASADASADYRDQADAARAAHRGIWR
jgi:hypothetical protein